MEHSSSAYNLQGLWNTAIISKLMTKLCIELSRQTKKPFLLVFHTIYICRDVSTRLSITLTTHNSTIYSYNYSFFGIYFCIHKKPISTVFLVLQACPLILVLINHHLMSTTSLKREENDPWPVVQHGILCVTCLSAEEVGGSDSNLELPITIL